MELFLAKFYSDLYDNQRERSDSPEPSRTSLSRRVRRTIRSLDRPDFILDLGAGPQIVTHQILRDRPSEHPKIVTLDLAKIPHHRLLAWKKTMVILEAVAINYPLMIIHLRWCSPIWHWILWEL